MHRRIIVAIVTVFLCGGAAAAQVPKGNVFFGYSYNHADFNAGGSRNLNGWEGTLEGKFLPFIGIAADISGNYGSGESLHNVIFGPQLSVPIGRFTPFAHALVGVGHISGNGASDTSLSDAFGGGVDYKVVPLVGWRFQVDALQTRFFIAVEDHIGGDLIHGQYQVVDGGVVKASRIRSGLHVVSNRT